MPKGVYRRSPRRYCKVGHDMNHTGRRADTHCSLCLRIRDKIRGQKAKVAVMSYYGEGKCACCGEKEIAFLTLDHINNDGALRRKNGQPGGITLFRWLQSHGFPSLPLQVLCWNCNAAKYYNHGCPHQEVD